MKTNLIFFGNEQLAQGQTNTTEYLRANPDICNRVIDKIKEVLPAAAAIKGRPPAAAAVAEAEAAEK